MPRCTGCGKARTGDNKDLKLKSHPLLFAPICVVKEKGAFAFAILVPKLSVWAAESQRILNMSDRWSCIVCSPQPLLDLCAKNNWNYHGKSASAASGGGGGGGGGSRKRAGGTQYICEDVSRGREKFEIPVINEVDNAAAPLDFVYVTSHVAGENVVLSNFGWFHPTAK
eukprot:gene36197-47069_t